MGCILHNIAFHDAGNLITVLELGTANRTCRFLPITLNEKHPVPRCDQDRNLVEWPWFYTTASGKRLVRNSPRGHFLYNEQCHYKGQIRDNQPELLFVIQRNQQQVSIWRLCLRERLDINQDDMIIIGGRGKMDIGLTSRRRKDNVKNMKEKEQLEKLISEYDNVATHYNEFSIASRGIRRPGEQRTHAH